VLSNMACMGGRVAFTRVACTRSLTRVAFSLSPCRLRTASSSVLAVRLTLLQTGLDLLDLDDDDLVSMKVLDVELPRVEELEMLHQCFAP